MSITRVAELACVRSPLLRELTTTVVSCEPTKVATSKKKSKAGDKSSAAGSGEMYDIICSDSVLFPEGGGQPCDYGTLQLVRTAEADDASGSGGGAIPPTEVPITNAQRRGGTCVLTSPSPFPVGAVVVQKVDWARRLDHMQHHTGQHLLTAMVERADTMRLPTISWSLTHPTCFITLDIAEYLAHPERHKPYSDFINPIDKKISNEMIKRIEDLCNASIAEGTDVYYELFESLEACQAEAESRKAVRMESNGDGGEGLDIRGRVIPEDVVGPIRTVTIRGIDSCTCCGTHLPSLARLHVLHVLHQEVKGGTLKLHFITGNRAIERFRAMHERERGLALELGVQPQVFVSSVHKRIEDAVRMERRLKRWATEDLAEGAAKALEGEIRAGACEVATLRRDDIDLDFFYTVRSKLTEAGLGDVVLVSAWASDVDAQIPYHSVVPSKNVIGQVMISGSAADKLEKVSQITKEVLKDLKGGMSKQGFRGKGSLKEWDKLVEVLKDVRLSNPTKDEDAGK
ncbi:unnamed protein product [Phytomonas sp. EM1]|nr:unnamed protein product [Phytomonas sp. EM1]|eukprot:CCW62563.1 unnamed protein product [Phytomonas sp. isolate EM1]